MVTDEFQQLLDAATQRIEYGNAARAAGADEKALLIEAEATRRGRGGPASLAADLGVTKTVISQACTRARRIREDSATAPRRRLPADALEHILAAELRTVPPLPLVEWQRLAGLVRDILFDAAWIEAQPGPLLASRVEDAARAGAFDARPLAGVLRSRSRAQALAVIDICQSDNLAALPTT